MTAEAVNASLSSHEGALNKLTKDIENKEEQYDRTIKNRMKEFKEMREDFFKFEGIKEFLFWTGMCSNAMNLIILTIEFLMHKN